MNTPTLDAAYEVLLSIDDPEESQKTIIKTGRAKNKALVKFTMSFDTASIISIVNGCTTTDFTNGLEHMVVTKLNNEYEPDNRVSQIELIRELSAIRMKDSDEPK